MTTLHALALACVITTQGVITTITCGNDPPFIFINPPFHAQPGDRTTVIPPTKMWRGLAIDPPLTIHQFAPSEEEEDDDGEE